MRRTRNCAVTDYDEAKKLFECLNLLEIRGRSLFYLPKMIVEFIFHAVVTDVLPNEVFFLMFMLFSILPCALNLKAVIVF